MILSISRFWLVSALAGALWGCSSEPFSQQWQDDFTKDCLDGLRNTKVLQSPKAEKLMEEFCRCGLASVKAHYPNSHAADQASESEVLGVVEKCTKTFERKVLALTESALAQGEMPMHVDARMALDEAGDFRNNFLDKCVLQLQEQGKTDTKAMKAYCLCSLEMMARTYPENVMEFSRDPNFQSKLEASCAAEMKALE